MSEVDHQQAIRDRQAKDTAWSNLRCKERLRKRFIEDQIKEHALPALLARGAVERLATRHQNGKEIPEAQARADSEAYAVVHSIAHLAREVFDRAAGLADYYGHHTSDEADRANEGKRY